MRQLFTILSIILGCVAYAQPAEQRIKVIVAPDHSDWTYKVAEKVKFTITVLRDGNPVKDAKVQWEYGPEKVGPIKKDSSVFAHGTKTFDAGTMKAFGFMRCIAWTTVDGKDYRGLATVGFDPQSIHPTASNPPDFKEFWEGAKKELAKIPIDAKMTLLRERCTENVNVYQVSIQNFRLGTRLYGILCVPKAEGKYPALLEVPGAGVRPYPGNVAMAEKGIITLQIGIHGIPVDMEPHVYTDLGAGALSNYPNYNLDNRDRYYYKRVYLGCIRANDFLTGLPEYDGTNLAVSGGSQGGALSIVTAALDPRVKFLAAYYPALSDITGYLSGRAGGWPHVFNKDNLKFNDTREKRETVMYYDVVNFAKMLKVPGLYSWGFNDETCPPTSMYAAYNSIEAPKELMLVQETGHWTYPEQREKFADWLEEKLTGGDSGN